MQIETTTITTEQQTLFGDTFQITIFEQTINAFCDCCPNQASGAKDVLQSSGWHVGQREQFCPECNY